MKNKYMYKECKCHTKSEVLLQDKLYRAYVTINNNKMFLMVDHQVVDAHTINYCPICKEKLFIGRLVNKGAKSFYTCNYCRNDEYKYPILAYYDRYYNTSYQVYIENNSMLLIIDEEVAAKKKIHRCPVCRRRLKKHYE